MITAKDSSSLPEDPEKAFIMLVDLLNDRLSKLDGEDWRGWPGRAHHDDQENRGTVRSPAADL
jgi:hypothetical protein